MKVKDEIVYCAGPFQRGQATTMETSEARERLLGRRCAVQVRESRRGVTFPFGDRKRCKSHVNEFAKTPARGCASVPILEMELLR